VPEVAAPEPELAMPEVDRVVMNAGD
jgi:hypothetical protein